MTNASSGKGRWGPAILTTQLSLALDLRPKEHVALVGAGGKTSLLLALAQELQGEGCRVVTSTTTMVSLKEAQAAPALVLSSQEADWQQSVVRELDRFGQVFLGREILESEKVGGMDPSQVDLLYREAVLDYLVVEADGAARRPVKAPGGHEPVIAASTSLVVAMVGLEVLGQEVHPDRVFRLGQFREVTGLEKGEQITAQALARLFLDPQGLFRGTPPHARRIPFLNKLDLANRDQEAFDLATLLIESSSCFERVIVGSLNHEQYWVFQDGRKRDLSKNT